MVSSTSTINGKTEYEYDENGSLISEQIDGEEITYEYTVEQRLSAVREGDTLLMAASYDGDGNRVFQVSRKEAEQYVEKQTHQIVRMQKRICECYYLLNAIMKWSSKQWIEVAKH